MANITVSADILTLMQSASNSAARTNLGLGTAATTAATAYATAAQGTKVDFLTVTQAVDLDQAEIDIAANTAKVTYPSADSTKLSGIATSATANSADATLLARANHTGTQVASTISDFDTEVSNNTNVAANTAKVTYPSADSTKLSGIATGAEVNTIDSAVAGEPTGSDVVLNVVSLTQAEYDAGTPVSTTFYIITA